MAKGGKSGVKGAVGKGKGGGGGNSGQVNMTFNPIDYAAILAAFKNAVPLGDPSFPGWMSVSLNLTSAQNLFSSVVGALSQAATKKKKKGKGKGGKTGLVGGSGSGGRKAGGKKVA
jgi:hypothetical protein